MATGLKSSWLWSTWILPRHVRRQNLAKEKKQMKHFNYNPRSVLSNQCDETGHPPDIVSTWPICLNINFLFFLRNLHKFTKKYLDVIQLVLHIIYYLLPQNFSYFSIRNYKYIHTTNIFFRFGSCLPAYTNLGTTQLLDFYALLFPYRQINLSFFYSVSGSVVDTLINTVLEGAVAICQ